MDGIDVVAQRKLWKHPPSEARCQGWRDQWNLEKTSQLFGAVMEFAREEFDA